MTVAIAFQPKHPAYKRQTVTPAAFNAFSRYENGKTKPPLALVKLFKLLDRHPDLLSELKAT